MIELMGEEKVYSKIVNMVTDAVFVLDETIARSFNLIDPIQF